MKLRNKETVIRNLTLKAKIYLKFPRIKDFAEVVGEAPAQVSSVIAGQEPGKSRKERYATVLGVPLEEIFPEEVSCGR